LLWRHDSAQRFHAANSHKVGFIGFLDEKIPERRLPASPYVNFSQACGRYPSLLRHQTDKINFARTVFVTENGSRQCRDRWVFGL
jgi:hypothetical protein